MISFTSPRERRLWMFAAIVLAGIFATVWVSGSLVEVLQRRALDSIFVFFFFGLSGAILLSGLTERPGRYEVWIILGVLAAFALLFVRLGLTERTHLFEYGLVSVLIYQALVERKRNGGAVPAPAVIAVIATAALGWLDEGVQSLVPGRVYDLVDVGFNALAGLVCVFLSATVGAARRWFGRLPGG